MNDVEAKVRKFIEDNFLFRDDRAALSDERIAARRRPDRLDRHPRAGRVPRSRLRHRHGGRRDRSGQPRLDRGASSAYVDGKLKQAAAANSPVGSRRAERGRKEQAMRVERFLRDSARRFPDKTALVAGGRRLSFAELDALSDRLAAALVAARARARRPRRRVHGQLLGGGGRDLRGAQGRRRVQPDQPVDQGRQARLRPQQLPRQRAPHPDARSRRWSSEALAECAVGQVHVVAGGGRDSGGGARLARRSPRSAPPGVAGHRPRPRHADLHLGLDRLPQGRDDDAPEHRRRRHLDHHLSREHAPTTSSSTCCRSRSTTASTRC